MGYVYDSKPFQLLTKNTAIADSIFIINIYAHRYSKLYVRVKFYVVTKEIL